MYIQWCLKGIQEQAGFSDNEARGLLRSGIPSNWLRQNASLPLWNRLAAVQQLFSPQALFDHVNDYESVGTTSPYISLSAGVVQFDNIYGSAPFPAWFTATDFATSGATGAGFVYRVWTVVAPKPASELLHLSDEIRDLNLFRGFWQWNHEGEIAAKLLVPSRNIEGAVKIDRDLNILQAFGNPWFVRPETVCNLVEEI
jgi:hypothetical protein